MGKRQWDGGRMWFARYGEVSGNPSRGGCRWIEGDAKGRARDPALFCGAACVEGSSWCPGHEARVFVPNTTRQQMVRSRQLREAASL